MTKSLGKSLKIILSAAYAALEDQLAALGERWAHLCHWVEERGTNILAILPQWQHLEEEQSRFDEWLRQKETILKNMSEIKSNDPHIVLDQAKQLEQMEQDMELHHRMFEQLTERTKGIVGKLEKGSVALLELTRQLERTTRKWDKLVQEMEALSKKVPAKLYITTGGSKVLTCLSV